MSVFVAVLSRRTGERSSTGGATPSGGPMGIPPMRSSAMCSGIARE
jgi:hypothetical protein